MPIIKSAKKQMRKAEKRRERNRALKTYLKNLRKETLLLLEDPKTTVDQAKEALNLFKSKIDNAWAKGIYKRNKSSRLISRMEQLFNQKFGQK